MSSEQFFYLVAVLAFLSGASAILKVRTMQNTIDRQGELIEVTDRELSYNKSKRMELEATVKQQQQQIQVLTNTVNSSELIRAMDEHLSELFRALDDHLADHHREAMEKFDRWHRDFVALRSAVAPK